MAKLEFSLGVLGGTNKEIIRDVQIRDIDSLFGPACRHIMVEGGIHVGKTNLLRQYANYHSGQVIQFEISANPLQQRQHTFLFECCTQISSLLESNDEKEIDSLSTEGLKALFSTQVIKLAKRCEKGERYFFIIDGLEHSLHGLEDSRIIDVFPPSAKPNGPFILSSCRSDVLDKLPMHVRADRLITPASFGFSETKDFFSDLNLPEQKIWQIQQHFQGVPGYLKVIHEILSNDPNFDIAGNHPGLESLVERQVRLVLDIATLELISLLNYLAASPVPLSMKNLADLTGLNPSKIEHLLSGSTLVRREPKTQSFEILNALTRTTLMHLLNTPMNDLRSKIAASLHVLDDREKLAVLLRENDDYEGMQQLIDTGNIIRSISDSKDIFGVMKQLQYASELAAKEGQIDGFMKWTMGMAALKSFAQHLVNESEIKALLSIGKSQDAIRRAYALPDNASKIRMLARSYTLMRQRGEQIAIDIKEELMDLVRNLRLEEMDKESLREIGFDLFPIVPDFAVQFLENVVEAENRSGIIDYAIQATLATVTESSKGMTSSEEIIEASSPHLVRMYSTWLDGVSYTQLRDEVDSSDSTRAKEYLIRQWCRHHLSSQHLEDAILLWIEVVAEDTKLTIPLRSLRQMSSYLLELSIEARQALVKRFQAPLFTSLDSPKDEWIRFRLNLIESSQHTPESASEDLSAVLDYIEQNVTELDSKTFALMCLKGSCLRLVPMNSEELIGKIDTCFQESFEKLLVGSADHFKVLRKTLQAMVDIDAEYALISAINLNTKHRRTQALNAVIRRLLMKQGTQDKSELLQEALNELHDDALNSVVLGALIGVNVHNVMVHPNNLNVLEAASNKIEDPYEATLAAMNLAVALNRIKGSVSRERLNKIVEVWSKEEDLKRKIALGYKLVEEIGSIDVEYAEDLYNQVEELQLQPGSNLAHGELGSFFVESLLLAIRSLNRADFVDQSVVDRLYELINRIPASHVRVRLFANLASAAFRNGNDSYAQAIVRERVVSLIEHAKDKALLRELVESSFPVIYRYDPDLAKRYIGELSPVAQQSSWLNTIVNILSNRLLVDLDLGALKLICENDQPTIKKAISALSNLHHDLTFFTGLSTIVNSILESLRTKKLDTYKAFDLLEQVQAIAETKLPDKANIQHDGYLVLARSSIHKVRSIAHKVKQRAGLTTRDINRTWQDIVNSALQIPNSADRVYVLALIAHDLSFYHTKDRSMVRDILSNAKKDIVEISTFIDRIDRLTCIAETWNAIGEASLAQTVFAIATDILMTMEQLDRDQQLSLVVDSAYKINADLADQIVMKFDSRGDSPLVTPAELALEVEKLVANPTEHRLTRLGRHHEYVIMQAAARLHRDLVNGMGSAQTQQDLLGWIAKSQNYSPDAVLSVINWVVENRYLSDRYMGSGRLTQAEVFTHAATLALELSRVSSGHIRGQISDALNDSFPGLSMNIVTFAAGEVEKAQAWLHKWLYENAYDHLIICDPYFGPDEIQYLRYAPNVSKVQIVTTDYFFASFESAEAIKSHIKSVWRTCSGQSMPTTQLFIVPKDLEEQFHDRAVISKQAGLNLGQSLNGLGKKRGNITVLAEKDANQLRVSYIDNMLDSSHWFMDYDVSPIIVSIKG